MPASASLPPEFAWLSPSCRPTPEEIRTYAHLINEAEHNPPEHLASCLREAELQLWIWRNDARKRAPKRRRSARPKADIIAPETFDSDSAA